MTTVKRFVAEDLFRLAPINLDHLTETYNLGFYLQYMARWPEYFIIAENPDGRPSGYIMGKAEGRGMNWHGHVTALTVAPESRRIGLAKRLMKALEDTSEFVHNGYFVDLFVRVSNSLAIGMYKKLGYTVYRRVLNYYSGDEDAFDMRKALPRDVDKFSIIPLPNAVRVEDLEQW